MTVKKIEIGDVFPTNEGGSVTVIEYNGCEKVLIRHNDDHRYEDIVQAANLRRGGIRNPFHRSVCGVGYLGTNVKIKKSDEVLRHVSRTWRSMISRCYNQRIIDMYPSYEGCTVCPEWHNFTAFSEWLMKNPFYGFGYDLDKDLLFKGNKIYSPTTCCLIPSEINILLTNSLATRGNLPLGVSFDKGQGKYKASVSINGKMKNLGWFDCEKKASEAYAVGKKIIAQELAEKWRNLISDDSYNALVNRDFK